MDRVLHVATLWVLPALVTVLAADWLSACTPMCAIALGTAPRCQRRSRTSGWCRAIVRPKTTGNGENRCIGDRWGTWIHDAKGVPDGWTDTSM